MMGQLQPLLTQGSEEEDMRLLMVLSLALLLSGIAAAQATQTVVVVGNGNASTYNVYAVPRIVTPSVSLQAVVPSSAGASNATWGNVAGARNSTLSIVTAPPVGVYTQPVWYSPEPPSIVVEGVTAAPAPAPSPSAGFGSASFPSNQGAARLVAAAGQGKKASRSYTNADIDRLNQDTGNVKYDGKTEKVN
jgi:hypothetical protein